MLKDFCSFFFHLGCGGIISLERQGKINVRGSNKQAKMCRWLSIPSPPSSFNVAVHFHFTYFDIPCHHGHLTVHSRNGKKKEVFCDEDPPLVPILLSRSQIALEMQLKKGSDVRGFELHYRTEYLGKKIDCHCMFVFQVLIEYMSSVDTLTPANEVISPLRNYSRSMYFVLRYHFSIRLN